MREIVLASASPRRRELLQQIGIAFRVAAADVDETPMPGEEAAAYTLRLALAKARVVHGLYPEAVVIGADTTVTLDGLLLLKPSDAEDAKQMLRRLRNRSHAVLTGVAVMSDGVCLGEVERTTVFFGEVGEDEIDGYVASGEPMDKAGAYGIQGVAARWVTRIEGDYSNVVGLPLARVYGMLRTAAGQVT